MKKTNSKLFIDKKVRVIVDRPLGSFHPKRPELKYPVNYGYVPDTISGDGKELDVYILGVSKALKDFEGQCIAVIVRKDDDDDKLIVVPEGIQLSDDENLQRVYFQEQYFESYICRQREPKL